MKDNTIYTGQSPPLTDENDEITPNNKESNNYQSESDNYQNNYQNEEEYKQGHHPNSLKALEKHQFPKGISGNQLGRPFKYSALAKILDKVGDEISNNFYGQKKDLTKRQRVLETIWDKAMRGDIQYVRMLVYLGCLEIQAENKSDKE